MLVAVAGFLALSSALASPSSGRAVPPGRGIVAPSTRVDDHAIHLDGRPTEAAWQTVPRLPPFLQHSPRFGQGEHHETIVRVAYGKKGLYFAIVAHDVHGDGRHTRGTVARKDQIPPTDDRIGIMIDPNHDHTNGFFFEFNPAGSQADAQMSRDYEMEFLWDGVWRVQSRQTETGWSAEVFIPWSTLRFDPRERYTFGLNFHRMVNEDQEFTMLSLPPQGVPGLLSFGVDYVGIENVSPGLNLELRPYVSGRFSLRRPDDSLDHSMRAFPSAGLESKYGIRGNLTLDLAVNPDFGQAEVDPAVLNLGPFELFFPERRQFFLESKSAFASGFNLFHSRRVGNAPSPKRADLTSRIVDGREEKGELVGLEPQTRILEAVRLTGEPAPGWRTGVFTATTGPTYGTERFSNGLQNPITVDPTSQYSVVSVRRQFDSQTHLGAIATSVFRAGAEPGAVTGGMNYAFRFRRRYFHDGEVIGTHDGKREGMGARAGIRRTGKYSEFQLNSELLTPHANFNDLGFMQFANYVKGDALARFYNAKAVGPLRFFGTTAKVGVTETFDGIRSRNDGNLDAWLTTMSLWTLTGFVGGTLRRLDPFETRGGIPYQFPRHYWTGGSIASPQNRRASVKIWFTYGAQGGKPGPDVGLDLETRPVDRLQIILGVATMSSFNRPRWVATRDDDVPIFGRADVVSQNLTGRVNLGITPLLTLQSYNQLFYSIADHDRFFTLDDPYTLTPTDGAPYLGRVDKSYTALISNSILRYEYLPGSFLYVVYTHRSVLDEAGERTHFAPGRAVGRLGGSAALHEDLAFVKLVHLFGM